MQNGVLFFFFVVVHTTKRFSGAFLVTENLEQIDCYICIFENYFIHTISCTINKHFLDFSLQRVDAMMKSQKQSRLKQI